MESHEDTLRKHVRALWTSIQHEVEAETNADASAALRDLERRGMLSSSIAGPKAWQLAEKEGSGIAKSVAERAAERVPQSPDGASEYAAVVTPALDNCIAVWAKQRFPEIRRRATGQSGLSLEREIDEMGRRVRGAAMAQTDVEVTRLRLIAPPPIDSSIAPSPAAGVREGIAQGGGHERALLPTTLAGWRRIALIIAGIAVAAVLCLAILVLPQVLDWRWLTSHPHRLGLQGCGCALVLVVVLCIFDPRRRKTYALGLLGGVILTAIQMLDR